MKSYIQGLITGIAFAFTFMVLIGNQKPFSKTFKITLPSKKMKMKWQISLPGKEYCHQN